MAAPLARSNALGLAQAIASWILVAAGVGAQVRVSLQGEKPSELERQVLALADASSRPGAAMALWAAGRPAVPLLLKAAQRDDAASLAALGVLAALHGTAREAYPALARLAQAATPLGRAAALAAASIGERDSIVVADYSGNRIVELDGDGVELRSVAVNGPWCVQPIGGDHLLVCCYQKGRLVEIDWQGKEIASRSCPGHPIAAQRCVDGSTLVAEASAGTVQRIGAGGEVLATWQVPARQLRVLCNDHVLVLQNPGQRLREFDASGAEVRACALRAEVFSFDVLPDGRIRLGRGRAFAEIGADGSERDVESPFDFTANALAGLRDGRWLCGEDNRLTLRQPDGRMAWEFPCKLPSSVTPRLEDRR